MSLWPNLVPEMLALNTGTTQPVQQVSLRSQAEGQLLSLAVDVGDPIQQGQSLANLDSSLLQTDLGEAQAELAARQFEVAQAEAQLADNPHPDRTGPSAPAAGRKRRSAAAVSGRPRSQFPPRKPSGHRRPCKPPNKPCSLPRTNYAPVSRRLSAAQQRVAAQAAMVQQAQRRLSYGHPDRPPSPPPCWIVWQNPAI